jgi:hypothetical protein
VDAVKAQKATGTGYGFTFTANKEGKAGNVEVTLSRTEADAADKAPKVVIAKDGSAITLTKDATEADVNEAVKNQTELPYKVDVATIALDPGQKVAVQLKGGVDAASAKIVLTLDNEITKVNKLTIGKTDLTTASTITNGGRSITANVESDADGKPIVSGKVIAQVTVNGVPVTVADYTI